MKVVFYSAKPYDQRSFDSKNTGEHEFVYCSESLSLETLSEAQGADAVCLFVNDVVDDTVMKQLEEAGVKLILLRCAGFDKVDIESLQESTLQAMRVPFYSPYAVAEHAIGLILTLNRKIHKAYHRVQTNNFSLEGLTGFDLHGKTVGVIGTGIIGAIFSKIMLGFGCKILAYDIVESQELRDLGIQYVTLEELCKESDIISLHCPLFPATKHMINAESLSQMKSSVMIVNTSRGALVNTADVLDALKQGKISYYAADVYENESDLFFNDHSGEEIDDPVFEELRALENVLITPHQAFFTSEALDQIATVTIQNIEDFQNNNSSDNYVG